MTTAFDPPLLGRVLGEYVGDMPGPLLLVTAGLHGNEPGGVHAARRVLAALREAAPPFRGRLVALAGNLEALRRGSRFLERDLNRAWWEDDLARLRRKDAPRYTGELGELQELLAVLDELLEGRDGGGDVVLLDLHSTSAAGAPFAITADTIQNRAVAFALGIPVILGLEELVEGTLLSFVGGKGHVAVVVEGGQNDAERTVEHLEAAVWRAMVAAGNLGPGDLTGIPQAEGRRTMEEVRGLPRAVAVCHRHGTLPEDEFRMEPGFTNFQRVRRGQVLAHSGRGPVVPVTSPLDGMLLLPRYQGQGDDGFFVGREIRPLWLVVSAGLRRLRVHRLLPWLPGVRRDPTNPQLLRADLRLARWYTRQLFHLLGFRYRRRQGNDLVFVRRPDVF